MFDIDTFRAVSESYSEKFDFDPYYSALIQLLEQYTSTVRLMLEIGAANGIIPEKWDVIRKNRLEYYSVDPVEEMVNVAKQKTSRLSINYHPFCGNLENALEVCNISHIDALLMSRSLHEIYLSYGKNIERVFSVLSTMLITSRPDVVIFGDAERNTSLTPDETKRFIASQIAIIGHGHDPATDYLDFATVVRFMKKSGYRLVDERKIYQPLSEFKKSAWGFRIGVFHHAPRPRM